MGGDAHGLSGGGQLSLGICRTELLAQRRDASVALGNLRLLCCDLGFLGGKRLCLLFEACLLLGNQCLEALDLVVRNGVDCGNDGGCNACIRHRFASLRLGGIASQNGIVRTLLCGLRALLRLLQLILKIVEFLLGNTRAGISDGHSVVARVVRCLHAIQGAGDDSRLGDVFAMREIINHRHVLEG